MKLIKGLLITTAAVSALAISTNSIAASAGFNINATVLAGLVVTKTSDMTFSPIETTTSAQTQTIAPADSGAAIFTVAGTASQALSVSITGNSTLTCSTAGTCNTETMSVDTFTYGGDASGSGTSGTATLSGAGAASVRVGARLSVAANQLEGTYSGSQTLNVNYA